MASESFGHSSHTTSITPSVQGEGSSPAMPFLRQALDAGGNSDAGGNNFSFATPTAKKSHGPDTQGAVERGIWTQRVKGSQGYFGRQSQFKSAAQPWGFGRDSKDLGLLDGEEFKGLIQPEDAFLDDTSPTLWGRSSPKARPRRPVPLYPSSQAQIMAKYRQEMMELVRDMPESAYELSLRDLVEVPRMAKAEEEDAGKERGGAPETVTGRDKKNEKKMKNGKKQIVRSTSMDSGAFLLKMFFPVSLGGRRKSGVAGSGSKVSPKPVLAEGDKGRIEKGVDAELLGGCTHMNESSRSDSNGQRRKMLGCYPFSINKVRI